MENWLITLTIAPSILCGSAMISRALEKSRRSTEQLTTLNARLAAIQTVSSIAGSLIGGWLSNPRFDEQLQKFLNAPPDTRALFPDVEPWDLEPELKKMVDELTVFEPRGRKRFLQLAWDIYHETAQKFTP
jgi:hypothetical protein